MRQTTTLALAALLSLTATSCLIGSETTTEHSGTYVSQDTLETIQPGMAQADVRAILGAPTSQVTMSDGAQLWKWDYSVETTKSGGVIFLVASKKTEKEQGTAYVQFDAEAKVARSWRD